MLVGKAVVAIAIVCADADYGGSGVDKIGVGIAEGADFGRAAGRKIFWVKEEHDGTAIQLADLSGGAEVGRLVAGLQGGH